MELPEWLKKQSRVDSRESAVIKRPEERFIDKTLRHTLSFTEDIMFNERVSTKTGLLQIIEPRLKITTLLIFIILLSLQRSIDVAAIFLLTSLSLALLSKIPLSLFLKRLFPIALLTTFLALPASLSIIVEGEPLLIIHRFDSPCRIGPIDIPEVISLTGQGFFSASMLILRVITSVSIVFLITLTTPPERLIKAFTYFMPGILKSIVSISYRYIFFLVRKLEEFIMGLKSRSISPLATRHPSLIRQSWVASRIGLLFSLSLKLSQDLEKAMESRGYKFGAQSSEFRVLTHDSRLTTHDFLWLIFGLIFTGVMFWKSLN